jgi:hypothetical protein
MSRAWVTAAASAAEKAAGTKLLFISIFWIGLFWGLVYSNVHWSSQNVRCFTGCEVLARQIYLHHLRLGPTQGEEV